MKVFGVKLTFRFENRKSLEKEFRCVGFADNYEGHQVVTAVLNTTIVNYIFHFDVNTYRLLAIRTTGDTVDQTYKPIYRNSWDNEVVVKLLQSADFIVNSQDVLSAVKITFNKGVHNYKYGLKIPTPLDSTVIAFKKTRHAYDNPVCEIPLEPLLTSLSGEFLKSLLCKVCFY